MLEIKSITLPNKGLKVYQSEAMIQSKDREQMMVISILR